MKTNWVQQEHQRIRHYLNFNNTQDYEDANRGLIADIEEGIIGKDLPKQTFNVHTMDYLDKECPETVNPSLWRQSQLNRIHGLFEVVKGKIYQFRGYEIANMSFIRGEKGWIVIDTLQTLEAAKAGIELLRKHVENLPVTAVFITHSHGDHANGLESVLDEGCELYLPKDFLVEIVSENLFSGVAMNRRMAYMYGMTIGKNEKGFVGTGLGTDFSHGRYSNFNWDKIIDIDRDCSYVVDGVKVDFLFTPGAEAPTEMMMYFPELKALCTAEEINHLMHNLYTPRGAKVRNGKDWAAHIDRVIMKYGDEVEVSFGSHNWPTWGNERIVEYYEKQRDMYKFLHDQTLRFANLGYTPNELPEVVVLPDSLAKEWYNREYYGTVNHNIKSQYQLYLGYYDGNPVHLNELPPTILGKKYVEAIGGEERCVTLAKEAFEKGEHQWAVTLLNNVVFANPQNVAARTLMAEVYTEMGYMQESAVWRNEYLVAAQELLDGKKKDILKLLEGHNEKSIMGLPITLIFNMYAVMIDAKKIEHLNELINLHCTNTNEEISLVVKNCVMNVRNQYSRKPTLSLTFSKRLFWLILTEQITQEEFKQSAEVKYEGNIDSFFTLLKSMSIPPPTFEIIEPKASK